MIEPCFRRLLCWPLELYGQENAGVFWKPRAVLGCCVGLPAHGAPVPADTQTAAQWLTTCHSDTLGGTRKERSWPGRRTFHNSETTSVARSARP